MKQRLLLDAINYINDNGLDGVNLLKIPTVLSYGVNNAHANRREIGQIVKIWETEGLGQLSTTEQFGYFFTFNDRAKKMAADFQKRLDRRSLSDRLADDKFQKISTLTISVLSLLISAAAMLVAYLAYVKAK